MLRALSFVDKAVGRNPDPARRKSGKVSFSFYSWKGFQFPKIEIPKSTSVPEGRDNAEAA